MVKMLDNTYKKKERQKKTKILELHQFTKNTFAVDGFSFPNVLRVMAVKKETELFDLK